MVRIYHFIDYINGYLKLRFKGVDKIRFINLCKNNRLKVWDILSTEDEITFKSTIRSFYQMKAIRRKCRGSLRILEKKGLVFYIEKYKKRVFFLAGILLFLVLLKTISMFIWNISFDGNYSYTDVELLRFLNEHNITNGLKKKDLDCENIEFLIRSEYNDVTWVSAEIRGTQLIIHMKENFDMNIAKEEDRPYNIVSDVEGRIESIITRNGIPEVKKDDIVTEGQLLVNGVIDILNDNKEVINYSLVNADADIYAYVTHPYSDSFDLAYKKKEYTGRNNSAIELNFFNHSFYFTGFNKKFKNCDIVKDYKEVALTDNFYLPVAFGKIRTNEYVYGDYVYTKEEAEALAAERIQIYISKLEEKGIQIIENNVTIDTNDKQCIISGNFLVLQKIGKIEYIDESSLEPITAPNNENETGE